MKLGFVILVSVIFLAVWLAALGFYWSWAEQRTARARELARRLGTTAQAEVASIFKLQTRDEVAIRLGRFGNYLGETIEQAGRHFTLRSLLTQIMLSSFGGFVVLFALTLKPVALVGLLLGGIPVFLLSRKGEKRSLVVTEQLPDALDLMARSLQAGHGIGDALRTCSEELQPPLAVEFGHVAEEHNLGVDFRVCMGNLLRRNPRNFDLKLFTSSVLLQRETGGNLVEILYNIATAIRARFLFKGKLRALTAEAKLSAWIIGMLPPLVALMIVIRRPGYLTPLVEDPFGRLLFMGGLASYALGIFIMSRLTRVDL